MSGPYFDSTGRQIPGVTTILDLSGYIDLHRIHVETLARAAEEGTYIHEMFLMEMQGTLDEAAVPALYQPRLQAWKKFRHQTGFIPDPTRCEQPVISDLYRYGGTPDWVGTAPPPAGKRIRTPAIVDYKRSIPSDPLYKMAIGLQLTGYALASPEPYYRRILFVPRDDGRPWIHEYPDWLGDKEAFLAAVQTAHAKLNRGGVKLPL